MYDSFYNLTEKPFQISTDPRFLWLGEKHREALANLKYGLLDRNGFIVLTGDIGTGKTTLVNALLDTLDDNVQVAKINHPSLETHEFFAQFAKALDPSAAISDKSDMLVFFNSYLQQAHVDGKAVLLIIDEAQHLSTDLMEEIRLLSNIEKSGEKLLSIIFVGQNELIPKLRATKCRALRQRITSFYDISALSKEEIRQYVDYRMKVSGSSEQLFTSAAIHKIYKLTRGIPRVINILCDRALLTGYVNNCKVIVADIIDECAKELDIDAEKHGMSKKDFSAKVYARWHVLWARLKTCAVSVKEMLRTVLPQLTSGRDTAVAKMCLTARSSFNILWDPIDHFIKKYRKKILPFALVVSFAAVSLTVTIGAFSAAKVRNVPSIAAKQLQKAESVLTTATGNKAPKSLVLWDDTQFERYLTVPSPSSSTEYARNAAVSVRTPMREYSVSTVKERSCVSEHTNVQKAKAALEQNKYQKALELLEAYPAAESEEDIESVVLYADALVGRAGEIMTVSPLEAEALLHKAIEVAPKMTLPYLMLGKHYSSTKDYARAIDAYQKAVHLDPTASDAFFNLGFFYATSGEYKEAEKAFTRVVQLRPSYLGKSLFNLAVVQQKLGKNKESISNMEELVSIEPQNVKAQTYLNQLRETTTDDNIGQRR